MKHSDAKLVYQFSELSFGQAALFDSNAPSEAEPDWRVYNIKSGAKTAESGICRNGRLLIITLVSSIDMGKMVIRNM